jgi:hypothetical protein
MKNDGEKRDRYMNDKKKEINKYVDDDWRTVSKDKFADLLMTSSYEIDT